jgi:hypothetical protein
MRIEASEKEGKHTSAKQKSSALKCLGQDKNREILTYACMIDGKQALCNGYLALAFNEPQPYLPMLPNRLEDQKINILKYITDIEPTVKAFVPASTIKELTVAQLADNKVRKKTDKNSKPDPCVIKIESFKIGFDPEYMNNVVNALGGYDACEIGYPEKKNAPFYIKSDIGSAIVLPVMVKQDEEENVG